MIEKRDRKNKILGFAEVNMRFEGFVITKEVRHNLFIERFSMVL